MPKVAEFAGIVIAMYFRDHPPTHFHAIVGDDAVVIAVDTLEVLEGSIPPRQAQEGARVGEEQPRHAPREVGGAAGVMTMVRVLSVRHVRDYKLDIRFRDGSRGVVDLADEVKTFSPFAPLASKEKFAEAYTDGVTVCWPGGLDLAPNYLYARVHNLPIPESMETARRNEQEMSLRLLREFAGMTQEEVAEALELPQSAVSRFENRNDTKVSTLSRYVAALGGRLEITAVIGDRRVVLNGFEEAER